MTVRLLATLSVLALTAAACGDDRADTSRWPATIVDEACLAEAAEPEPTPVVEPAPAELLPAASCDDVAAAIRRRALREMNAALDRNLEDALRIHCSPCTEEPTYASSGGFGCGAMAAAADYGGGASLDAGMSGSPVAQADAGVAHEGDSADEYSTTNNQVAEVDEPDFLKNDGAYIYVVANGKLRIIDAWPPETARTVATVPFTDGVPTGLFVAADRAVVYSTPTGAYTRAPCTYGYDCQFEGQGGPFTITVFDLADREHPRLLRRIELGGSLLTSRRMGNIVHTLVLFGDDPQQMPYYEDWPAGVARYVPYCGSGEARLTPAEIRREFAALRIRNTELIGGLAPTVGLPRLIDERHVPDVAGDGSGRASVVRDEQVLADCRSFYVSQRGEGTRLLSLVSFDLTAADPLGTRTVVGRAGAVYATPTSLYVAQSSGTPYDWYWFGAGGNETTAIHKFRLTENGVATTYVGTGVVEGHVLSQFAMDEHEGLLRVATSVGWVPDPDVHSVVSVLAEEGGGLTLIGQLDDLARGEDIRSVRFDGDVVYLVTFKKTDPLFIIDLADPNAPTVKSELKVPGFSTYMQMMDATHVLGLGFDAQDMGDFAWFQGIQLQIFDVTDPYRPKVLHKEVIGTRGTTSEAATNHLAFNYFAPKDLLALPIAICEESQGGGSYGLRMTFDGLLVYRATVADGFTRLGGLPHQPAATADQDGLGCWNWWTTPNSGVKRSIVMDDYVWAVALDVIRVAGLGDLEHPVASIDLR